MVRLPKLKASSRGPYQHVSVADVVMMKTSDCELRAVWAKCTGLAVLVSGGLASQLVLHGVAQQTRNTEFLDSRPKSFGLWGTACPPKFKIFWRRSPPFSGTKGSGHRRFLNHWTRTRTKKVLIPAAPRPYDEMASQKGGTPGPAAFLVRHLASALKDATRARPYITLTWAQSLDAKIAGPGGERVLLSGPESMLMTHW